MKKIFIGALLASSSLANAGVELGPTMRLEADIPSWNASFAARNPKAPSECRETREIAGAYLCLSRNQMLMHQMWFRASAWSEGVDGTPAGTLMSHSQMKQWLHKNGSTSIGGYDIPSDALLAFQKAATERCAHDSDYCLSADEKSALAMSQWAKGAPFVVISYALESTFSYEQTVTHEAMHAQYFLQPKYRAVVDAYWAALAPRVKIEVANRLEQAGYGSDLNGFLVRNEFQAFILMANPEEGLLAAFVVDHRTALLQALADQHIVPVQVY